MRRHSYVQMRALVSGEFQSFEIVPTGLYLTASLMDSREIGSTQSSETERHKVFESAHQRILRDRYKNSVVFIAQQNPHQEMDGLAGTVREEEVRWISLDAAISPFNALKVSGIIACCSGSES